VRKSGWDNRAVTVGEKLQLKPGQSLFVADKPSGLTLDLPPESAQTDDLGSADAALFFCVTRRDLERARAMLVAAAREDRLVWLGYPKARQLGTDLNRDSLWELLSGDGIRPVRQIAIDETWSALRFRPS
jgi:hypothetical protein